MMRKSLKSCSILMGGFGSIYAVTAIGALYRMEQLVQEAVITVPRALIAEAIDLTSATNSLEGSA